MAPDLSDPRLDVLQLQARYGDLVTRRDWTGLRTLFLPDCVLRLDLRGREIECDGVDEIVDFVAAGVGRFAFFLFSVENSVVDVAADGDEASGRVYIRETRLDEDGRESVALGLYRDRYRRTSAGWRFARRDYATLARSRSSGDGLEAFDVPRDDRRAPPDA